MADAIVIVMIDTLISLKIILILILGILALDEVFLGLQTTETANFYSSRASLVDHDIYGVDSFFNEHILKFFIFTKQNPFLFIENLETHRNDTTNELTTTFHVRSFFNERELGEINRSGFNESSRVEDIQIP
jgi:hypothetical protein